MTTFATPKTDAVRDERRHCLLDGGVYEVVDIMGNDVLLDAPDGSCVTRSKLWVRLWTRVIS